MSGDALSTLFIPRYTVSEERGHVNASHSALPGETAAAQHLSTGVVAHSAAIARRATMRKLISRYTGIGRRIGYTVNPPQHRVFFYGYRSRNGVGRGRLSTDGETTKENQAVVAYRRQLKEERSRISLIKAPLETLFHFSRVLLDLFLRYI